MNKKSFADLGVSPVVARALSERGIQSPFPVQASVIPDALAGHDVLVKSPTGSGKTLALGLPLVDLIDAEDARAAALVLAPTRELVSQIVEEIRPLATARALSIASV
jgi:superfamily II DNA/RNA helicase